MDDIQFWLYILFAVIYFISRGLKKKDPQKTVKKQQGKPASGQERPQRKPVSFEELLQEFTEGKSREENEPQPDEDEYQPVEELQQEEQEEPFEEGKTRRFSDEESKRVYEESIARAEGASLEFKPDEHFRSKLKRNSDEEEGAPIAAEIKEMLNNPEDARKAIILGEILNRKY